jgi:hypothetical protein
VGAERDKGGLGGFREGVGKTDGLGEGDKDSDIVEEKGGERKRKSRARVVNVTEELSCAEPRAPGTAGCLSFFSHHSFPPLTGITSSLLSSFSPSPTPAFAAFLA